MKTGARRYRTTNVTGWLVFAFGVGVMVKMGVEGRWWVLGALALVALGQLRSLL